MKLYLDGTLKNSWSKAGMNAGSYLYAPDYNIGILPAGLHTFKIVADGDNTVSENNEADNEYSRTITVIQRTLNVSPATVSIGNESGSN